jgi:hypothetical protein
MDEFTEKIKYFKCRSFLPKYCGIKYTSGIMRKLAGKNANGNPGHFSDEQKKLIITGAEKFIEELKALAGKNKA